MKSLQQQLKDIAKNIEKGLNKELAKKKINIPYDLKGDVSMSNLLLDKESEIVLKELVALKNEVFFMISDDEYPRDIIENLIDKGYLKVGNQGVTAKGFSGGYIAMVMVTRNGKCYEDIKERYENEQLNNKQKVQNNFNAPFNAGFVCCDNLTNCTSIIGDNANIQQDWSTNTEYIEKTMKEFQQKVNETQLSDEQRQEIQDMLDDIDDKKNKKKPHLIKSAIKGLWDFTKNVGAQALATYLTVKFGLNV